MRRLMLTAFVIACAMALAACGGNSEARMTSCVDIGRGAGLTVSPTHCGALNDLGILCEDGRPECGQASGPADRVRLCQAINIEYFAGDVSVPMPCRSLEEQGELCDTGWMSLNASDRPPTECSLPDDLSVPADDAAGAG